MGQVNSNVAALNADEKQSLQNSWTIVSKEKRKHGIAILLRFFEKYPDEQKKFAAFADVPHNELSGNAKFISHSLSIMFSLSSMISSLDDDEVNEALMMKQITNHKPRGVTLEKYKNLQGVIAEYLKPLFGDEDLKAWAHAFQIFNALVEANE